MNTASICILSSSVFACCLFLAGGPVAGQEPATKENRVEWAGIKRLVPRDWHETKVINKDSYKRYQLDAIDDDKYNAHVKLFRLGKVEGNTLGDVRKRWEAMFVTPQGATAPPASKVEKFKAGGLEFTTVDTTGAFKFADDPDSVYLDFRLIGVYVHCPSGVYLALLIGPSATVEAYRKDFESWIKADQ